MAKRPDLSSTQRKIVDRYYQQRDTLMATKLSETVSELYLCAAEAGGEKKALKLWTSVATALKNTATDPARVARILDKRDLQELAKLAGELATER